jgi:hypothetical protein
MAHNQWLGKRAFIVYVKATAPKCTSRHCITHRQALVVKKIPHALKMMLGTDEFIKLRPLNARSFSMHCDEMSSCAAAAYGGLTVITRQSFGLSVHTALRILEHVLKNIINCSPTLNAFFNECESQISDDVLSDKM